jgi:hypothetical protein
MVGDRLNYLFKNTEELITKHLAYKSFLSTVKLSFKF